MEEAHPPRWHPLYPLLDYDYDKDHRGAHMEYGPMDAQLPLLKPRTHTRQLRWDERYASYIRRAGFLELVRVVREGLPPLNPALLTAAVDR
jgi:hypothetical protein